MADVANLIIGPRVFLLGPHGCGKSTIGKHLAAQGYVHLSVGLIGRLARRRIHPSDLPIAILQAMARHTPGDALDPGAALEILAYARTLPKVVIDGFPAHVEHLSLLDDIDKWSFLYVLTPRQIREQRLVLRAETTRRGWTAGRGSPRDLLLPSLCRHLRSRGQLLQFSNG